MRNYHVRRNTKWSPSINLDKLWTLVSDQTRLKYKDHPEGKAPVIDIVKAVSFFISSRVIRVLKIYCILRATTNCWEKADFLNNL